jgi:hypothetical protein
MKQTTNTPAATFTTFDKSSNWVTGKCGDWKFEAKLYDDGSVFGINDGRVSKLEIKDAKGITVLNYDRGWDVENDEVTNPYFTAIMELLEKSPRRFDNE